MVERAAWRALGTGVHLLTDGLDPDSSRRSVERVLDAVDTTYRRFRPDSELQVVQATVGREVRIGPLRASTRATMTASAGERVPAATAGG